MMTLGFLATVNGMEKKQSRSHPTSELNHDQPMSFVSHCLLPKGLGENLVFGQVLRRYCPGFPQLFSLSCLVVLVYLLVRVGNPLLRYSLWCIVTWVSLPSNPPTCLTLECSCKTPLRWPQLQDGNEDFWNNSVILQYTKKRKKDKEHIKIIARHSLSLKNMIVFSATLSLLLCSVLVF
jgi:hypothetical protein